MEKQQQNWHPISMLPMMSTMISGQLEEAKNQYENLLKAQSKPYVLNDEIVESVIKVFSEQLDFICLYENQISKWHNEGTLTTTLETNLSKSQVQLQELSKVITNILALAAELKNGTIEKVMGKSDLELGMEFFKK
ncbi:hypothetical protein LL037_08600 [Clostridium estertheticum]|uniref:Uncharacterized protein n=1 Tax=Clostridium estertheticum TaxID=238834 RepID=A0AA47EEV4_9CLOT|nr:hypothetical protein [Clostridium estertheticum]MBU3154965.1 hypothetical protein [Clostridium estertheticum]MBU3200340.1 hypothetical protein [Clostridium estertheticum]WAG58785.1 hypothetical protein LL038_14090 [Clostridium estertheticum]WAG67173.1 hypothetical protein LL037_08600 [Clostridium estertheticum]